MSYSENTKVYGRKVLKSNKQAYRQRTLITMVLILVVGFIIGATLTTLIKPKKYGTIDDKTFRYVVNMDWSSGAESDYVVLHNGLDENVQKFIYYLSYSCNIDYAFVMGVIQAESDFQSDAISNKGDFGLMQINTVNHEWLTSKFGFTDYLDPYQNVSAGIYILRELFEKYEDPSKVLMAYNMGETGAKKLWDKGIFETGYSVSVLENAAAFTAEIERNGDEN